MQQLVMLTRAKSKASAGKTRSGALYLKRVEVAPQRQTKGRRAAVVHRVRSGPVRVWVAGCHTHLNLRDCGILPFAVDDAHVPGKPEYQAEVEAVLFMHHPLVLERRHWRNRFLQIYTRGGANEPALYACGRELLFAGADSRDQWLGITGLSTDRAHPTEIQLSDASSRYVRDTYRSLLAEYPAIGRGNGIRFPVYVHRTGVN